MYREQILISKSLALQAQPGAEIKGSDVWTSWLGNRSTLTVPSFATNGNCTEARCAWPEQVFVDGVAQIQVGVGVTPGAGQFALDSSRHIVLGTSPVGRTVEVTTRARWLTVTSGNVTVSGFRMHHAAAAPQTGGLTVHSVTNGPVHVENNVLSDAHGSVLSICSSNNVTVSGGAVFRGGNLGIHIGCAPGSDNAVLGVSIHDNNTEGFNAGWQAGGVKAAVQTRLTLDRNEVFSNDAGLWCDIDCRDIVVSNNRVHHNKNAGIFFEISTGARIFGNKVWENGWGFTAWGWGAGILISSSGGAEVYNNIVAWNADGITVASQGRPDRDPATNNYVHNNDVILSSMVSDESDQVLFGFLQDWSGPMYDAASNNRGAGNRYWYDLPDPSYCRFAWNGCVNSVAAFNATPGEEGARYLTRTERDTLLSAAGIPISAQPH